MSVHVLAAFMRESRSALGARLVGMVLSDSAWGDGITWLPIEEIALRANLSERQVYRCVQELEKLGELEKSKTQRGRLRSNVYRMRLGAMEPRYDELPFELAERFIADDLTKRQVVEDGRPDTDVIDDLTPTSGSSLYVRKRDVKTPRARARGAVWKVDRKAVTEQEQGLARLVLQTWNEHAGQSLAAQGWLAKIVMRIREHPELELSDHRSVIERVLANPWWRGAPTPSVIYGNDRIFEASLLAPVDGSPHAPQWRRMLARIGK